MTLDERLEYIATLQQTHDEQIGRLVETTDKLVEQSDRTEKMLAEHIAASTKRMDVLTERTIQAMDAINRLARIAGSHEDRIDALERPPQ
jgi:prophage DNA circulation protein